MSTALDMNGSAVFAPLFVSHNLNHINMRPVYKLYMTAHLSDIYINRQNVLSDFITN